MVFAQTQVRLLLAVASGLLLLLLYLALNSVTSKSLTSYNVMTDFDRSIPFIPETVWFYMLNIPLPLLLVVYVNDEALLEALAGFLIIFAISAVTFIAFPVHSDLLRAPPQPCGWDSWSLQLVLLCYTIDGVGNCFPSLHVAFTAYAGLWGWKLLPRMLLALYMSAVSLVIISTMTIKQHFLADVVAALIIAFGVFWMQETRRVCIQNAHVKGD